MNSAKTSDGTIPNDDAKCKRHMMTFAAAAVWPYATITVASYQLVNINKASTSLLIIFTIFSTIFSEIYIFYSRSKAGLTLSMLTALQSCL